MNIVKTPRFTNCLKKLHANQKKELDTAIKSITHNPQIGTIKKGVLSGLRVFKFPMNNQLTLLAYEYIASRNELRLIDLGSHENFYRDIVH